MSNRLVHEDDMPAKAPAPAKKKTNPKLIAFCVFVIIAVPVWLAYYKGLIGGSDSGGIRGNPNGANAAGVTKEEQDMQEDLIDEQEEEIKTQGTPPISGG